MLHTKVVVVGSINMDLVTRATQFARAGETLLGSSFHRYMGGKGANQAVAAARLGACVTIIGAVGDDDFGLEMVTNLRHEGICTDYVQTVMGQNSGMANITVADDENAIIVIAGANMGLTVADIENAEQQIASADVVLSQLEIPMDCVITAAKLAKKYGKPFILNPAPAQFLPSELWELVTLLTPNRYELADCLGLSQDLNPEELILKAPCPVLMTMGDKGAVYKDGKVCVMFPALKWTLPIPPAPATHSTAHCPSSGIKASKPPSARHVPPPHFPLPKTARKTECLSKKNWNNSSPRINKSIFTL